MVGSGIRVKGLDETLAKLNKEVNNIKRRCRSGMVAGGFIIKRHAQKNCPVDTSNLKASAFVVFDKGKVLQAVHEIQVPNFKSERTIKGSRGRDRRGRYVAGSVRTQKVDTQKLTAEHQRKIGQAEGAAFATGLVFVGFTAEYALFVHEDQEASHNVGGAKFLERAITENFSEIIAAIRMEAAA